MKVIFRGKQFTKGSSLQIEASTKRSNLQREGITKRSNLQREAVTKRSRGKQFKSFL